MIDPRSEFFVPFFVKAAREAGPKDADYRRLLDLIRRVDGGADLNELRDEAKSARAERDRAKTAAILAAPEPRDKTSTDWRIWTLRRIEAAMRGDDVEAAGEAWGEFWGFFDAFKDALLSQDAYTDADVRDASALLPMLIIHWQKAQGAAKRKAKAAR
jgi:hypothetical protein